MTSNLNSFPGSAPAILLFQRNLCCTFRHFCSYRQYNFFLIPNENESHTWLEPQELMEDERQLSQSFTAFIIPSEKKGNKDTHFLLLLSDCSCILQANALKELFLNNLLPKQSNIGYKCNTKTLHIIHECISC